MTCTELPVIDIDLPGTIALSVLAAAAAGRAVVEIRGSWREPANLYTATVLPPGSRKSAVHAAMNAPLLDVEEQLATTAAAGIAEAETQRDIADRAAAQAAAQASKADKENADKAMAEAIGAAHLAEAITIPVMPRIVADDITQKPPQVSSPSRAAGSPSSPRKAAASPPWQAGTPDSPTSRFSLKATLATCSASTANDAHPSTSPARRSPSASRCNRRYSRPSPGRNRPSDPHRRAIQLRRPGLRGPCGRMCPAWPRRQRERHIAVLSRPDGADQHPQTAGQRVRR